MQRIRNKGIVVVIVSALRSEFFVDQLISGQLDFVCKQNSLSLSLSPYVRPYRRLDFTAVKVLRSPATVKSAPDDIKRSRN